MQTEVQPQTINRNEFLNLVGTSIGAIILAHCLSGCSSGGDDDPTPATGTDFTLNLAESGNADLATNGGFIYTRGVIVARTKSGAFIAVSQACTHQGTSVVYRLNSDDLFCPNHGSVFSTTGAATRPFQTGQAALKQYKTQFNSSANTVRVFE
jgi:cytochrome b6-f complex iron-sulfur subunit